MTRYSLFQIALLISLSVATMGSAHAQDQHSQGLFSIATGYTMDKGEASIEFEQN